MTENENEITESEFEAEDLYEDAPDDLDRGDPDEQDDEGNE